jgi:hypothetical protein
VRLRLVRHPDQESDFARFPTSPLMMRHVYVLSSANLTNLDIRITRVRTGIQNPDVPPLAQQTTYLHMFGLDDLDASNNLTPDGQFDFQQANLLNRDEGFLFMPGPRPFSPPDAIVIQRLISGGVAPAEATIDKFANERVDPSLYTLPPSDPSLPHLEYQLAAVTTGTQTDIALPLEAIEGTEVVKLDGRTLQRGIDYDVEPLVGRITLKGDALASLTASSRIEVAYQFRPLFGGGKSTLLGVSAEYQLGTRGKVASVLLYESTGAATRRPKLGEEPTRMLVGDVNASLRFAPTWMTRLVNFLPLADAGAASSLSLAGEIAASLPNPNTRKDAYVEDLEGADDSDEQNLARTSWAWASLPIDDARRASAGADTLRVPVAFYNPVGRVKRGHLNPKLDEREINEGLTVLELGFDRPGFAARDALATQLGVRDLLWSGVMRSFGTVGLDLTRTKSIEFWLNDKIGDPAQRTGRLHIDFGKLNEDFVFRPSPLVGPTRFNREAPTAAEFDAAREDVGWDLESANCPTNNDDAERLPFGSECYRPEVLNGDDQHFLANGTEGNNAYDTEDLNGNGIFDEGDSYFGITLDLAAPDFIITDVTPQYGNDPSVPPDLRAGFQGWRKYRIDLDRVLPPELRDPTESSPTLRKITALRLWFEDTPGTPLANSVFNRNMQIYGLRLTRNQWLDIGVFAVDSTAVAPVPGESFSIGVINNKDDVVYELPPDAIEIDDQGIQSREQSLRINFTDIAPGHEVLAERALAAGGRGLDFTLYRRMTFFVHYPRDASVVMPDSAEFFFRVGSDTLNYYEIAHTIPGGGRWVPITVDLDQITGLKFPEDYPGAVTRVLERGNQRIVQVSAPAVDAVFRNIPLRVTRRGEPSLQNVLRLFVGVRNSAPGAAVIGLPPGIGRPVSGEVWFDNLRLEDVEKERGVAQDYSMTARFSDLIDVTGRYSRRDPEFRSLRQRIGSNVKQEGWQGRISLTDLGRVVPTLGFAIPLGYQYSWDRSLPKFFQNSDTRNTTERQLEQRTEAVRHAWNASVSKRPSRFWFNKVTLDRLQFSYNESRDLRRTFQSRDTSTTRTRTLQYDLSPRERPLGLWGKRRLNLVPTNLKFAVQHSSGSAIRYTVVRTAGVDSLVQQPRSSNQSLSLNASTALKPLNMLQIRYSFTEPRTFRQAHPYNERERVRLFGYDFGLPGNRTETINFDLTPRIVRLSLSVSFGDNRLQQSTPDGRPAPDLHNANSNRLARASFDFGLHRRLLKRLAPAPGSRPRQPPNEPPPNDGEEPVDPLDEGGGVPPRRDFAPQEPHEDSLRVLPPGIPPSDSLATPLPPALTLPDSLAPRSAPTFPAVDSLTAPPAPPPAPPPAAAADTTRRVRKAPNPIDVARGLLRAIAGIEAIKVEYSNSATAGYTNLPDAPSGAFRYGFSSESGLVGNERFVLPPGEDDRHTLDLSTGVPLTRAVRVATRYKRDQSVRTSRSFQPFGAPPQDRLSNTNEDHRLDVTFPSFDFTVSGIERLPLFRRRLQSSSVQVQFARGSNKSFRLDQLPGGPKVEGTGRNETERLTTTASWTGQWRGGVTSTLSLNQTNNNTDAPGSRREAVSRSATGGVRFKVAPQGGLRFPFVRGGLKGGMDIAVNASFNTEDATRLNVGNRPIVENNSTALTLGARGDYTLSRNMNGAVEIGYTRQARADVTEQTIHTVRLGFNLTFLF